MRTFLAELRRRNVYKVAVAYAVVAWIALQAASFLLPSFGAPEWVFRVLVLLVALGFAFAVAFSWAFELTPEGLKRTHEVPHEHSITHVTGRKLDFMIIGLLVVALGVSVYLNVREGGDGSGGYRAASIAVLPFTSRSVDPEHAMFADGIHDELLTSLANIGSLKVISRTSVMEYRNTTKNLRDIGKELGAATVLEGAVQRAGNNVRINVQLIDAGTDEHLWANTYDRLLSTDNLFVIQTEIATTIANKLKATLTPDEKERIEKVPTDNLQAYNLYLAGRQNLYQRKEENLRRARELFEQAIALDPQFAKAYSGLSDTINILYTNFGVLDPDELFPESTRLLDKALALDPNDADIQASIGLLASTRFDITQADADIEGAMQGFERALALNPNHSQAAAWYAGQEMFRGEYKHAIELFERALELDPLARVAQLNLGESYAGMGQHRKALDTWLESTRMNPDWQGAPEYLGVHLADLGRLDEACGWYLKARSLSSEPYNLRGSLPGIYGALGRTDRFVALMREGPRGHPFWAVREARVRQVEGNRAAGLSLLEESLDDAEYLPPQIPQVAARLAMFEGKFADSQRYHERACPLMTKPAPGFDDFGFCSAPGYAYALQKVGDQQRAKQILDAYLEYIADRSRLGIKGYGIADAESLALLGRRDDALRRLREAIDAGWRTDWPRYGWHLADDPYLAELQNDPRFRAMVAETDADIARMRERATQAETSGDWQPLLALAAQGEGRVAPPRDN
jgi:TolB-like protein